MKHKLVLKTDHLGWGPCTALLRPQNLIEKLLANYWPPFVSTMWSDLFCGEAFSGCGSESERQGNWGGQTEPCDGPGKRHELEPKQP